MAAGRKPAVVAVVALVAMLLVAGSASAAQFCGVTGGTMDACQSYCGNSGNKDACCGPLKSANRGCLCSYWRLSKSTKYASCADKIKSACGINGC